MTAIRHLVHKVELAANRVVATTELSGDDRENKLSEELTHLGVRELLLPSANPLLAGRDRLSLFAVGEGELRLTRTPLDDWASTLPALHAPTPTRGVDNEPRTDAALLMFRLPFVPTLPV